MLRPSPHRSSTWSRPRTASRPPWRCSPILWGFENKFEVKPWFKPPILNLTLHLKLVIPFQVTNGVSQLHWWIATKTAGPECVRLLMIADSIWNGQSATWITDWFYFLFFFVNETVELKVNPRPPISLIHLTS